MTAVAVAVVVCGAGSLAGKKSVDLFYFFLFFLHLMKPRSSFSFPAEPCRKKVGEEVSLKKKKKKKNDRVCVCVCCVSTWMGDRLGICSAVYFFTNNCKP